MIENLDRFFTRSAQRASFVVGLMGVTPYRLATLVVLIGAITNLLVPVTLLNVLDACQRSVCKGHAAASVSTMGIACIAIVFLASLFISATSFYLSIRRQREHTRATAQGNMMSAPLLFSKVLWGAFATVTLPVMCCSMMVLEVVGSVLVFTNDLQSAYGSLAGIFLPYVRCSVLALLFALCHAMVGDYLLKSMPRIRRSRKHAKVSVPTPALRVSDSAEDEHTTSFMAVGVLIQG